jgi:AcrR family transcriptional regulator
VIEAGQYSAAVDEMARRGRPKTLDPQRVALIALRLFEANGYDATSMDQIATEAGVSRRSLFNHFPTKGDLAWFGFEPFVASLDLLLEQVPSSEPLAAAIERCALGALYAFGEELHSIRIRTQIVNNHPELGSHGTSGLGTVRAAMQRFLERHLGLAPNDLDAFVLASAIEALVSSAFEHWARFSIDETPAATLHAALGALARLDVADRAPEEMGDLNRSVRPRVQPP